MFHARGYMRSGAPSLAILPFPRQREVGPNGISRQITHCHPVAGISGIKDGTSSGDGTLRAVVAVTALSGRLDGVRD
jgi:hypothetical protein